MKQVTIVVPDGKATLSTITGSLDILNSANAYEGPLKTGEGDLFV